MRYLLLVLATGLAGVLSSFMWLRPNAIMAALLGMSLSLGTIRLGQMQTAAGGHLSWRQVLWTGLWSGLLAGVAMALASEAFYPVKIDRGGHEVDFGPPQLPFWAPLIMGVLYGLVLHRSYYLRRFYRRPLAAALVSACLGCFLLKALGTAVYIVAIERDLELSDTPGIVIGAVLMAFFGAVPFAWLWIQITARLDPAFSSPAWADLKKRDDPPAEEAPKTATTPTT